MAVNEIKRDTETRMGKAIDTLTHDLSRIRTGRAHPSILDGVTVVYYDAPTPLNQLASIAVEDHRTLLLTPYDKAATASIDKAIRVSDLGLNPAISGNAIRVPLPPLTEERRLVLIKQTKAEAEKARVSVRNIRRDANNKYKELLKAKAISEDEDRRGQDEMQKLTDKYIANVDKLAAEKEAELMHI